MSAKKAKWQRYAWLVAVVWTVATGGSLAWNLFREGREVEQIATLQARSLFRRDQAIRLWASSHGGVYVPVDEQTQPSPYLAHIPDRDITSLSGARLTLMNPARIVRQLNERYSDLYGVAGHVTSLKPLRPGNSPDAWEHHALEAFEQGAKERRDFAEIDGKSYLRLMRPMVTEEGCLKCHGHQGYQVGNIRGGVSVSVPLAPLWVVADEHMRSLTIGHTALWLLGLLGIIVASRHSSRENAQRELAEEELRRHRDHLDELVQQRTADLTEANRELHEEIEQHKQTERELATQRYYLARAQELGKIGTWDLDITKNELTWTDENYRIFGVPSGTEMTYEHFLNCVHPDDREYVDREWNAAIKGKPYDIEHRLLIDGETKWVREKAELEFDEDGRCVRGTGFTQDITAHRQAEEALRRSELLRAEAEKVAATGRLAAQVAHEINNPLAGIKNCFVLLRDAVPADHPDLEFADMLGKEIDRIARIVARMHELHRPREESGRTLEVEKILKEVVLMMEPVAEARQVRIDSGVSPLGGSLRVPEDPMRQVLYNLLSNAVEASLPGDTVRVDASACEDSLRILVADEGGGIPSDIVEHIFEPFFSTKRSETTGGLGLGLSISKGIVESLGGHLDFESSPDQGTVFRVDLPLEESRTRESSTRHNG